MSYMKVGEMHRNGNKVFKDFPGQVTFGEQMKYIHENSENWLWERLLDLHLFYSRGQN